MPNPLIELTPPVPEHASTSVGVYLSWDGGREYNAEFDAVLKDGRIYRDTATFRGHGRVAGASMFLLELEGKDEPGATFYETIVMAPGKNPAPAPGTGFRASARSATSA